MQFAELVPKIGNRVFLTGMTGCGKSVLARRLLDARQDALVLIYDAKDEIKWPGYQRFTTWQSLVLANPRRAIYAPNIKELDNPKCWDYFFKFAFLRQRKNYKRRLKVNTVVYVDEAYAVTDGETIPFYYKAGLTRGRSMGLEIWSATQRPKNIPQFLMSEVQQTYVFFHQMPQDKIKLRGMFPLSEDMLESISYENHEFVYIEGNRISGKLKLKGV